MQRPQATERVVSSRLCLLQIGVTTAHLDRSLLELMSPVCSRQGSEKCCAKMQVPARHPAADVERHDPFGRLPVGPAGKLARQWVLRRQAATGLRFMTSAHGSRKLCSLRHRSRRCPRRKHVHCPYDRATVGAGRTDRQYHRVAIGECRQNHRFLQVCDVG
jgi:hypothetical protein